MLGRIVLAVIVGVAVTLGCILVGGILVALRVALASAVGGFLQQYAGAIGVLAALFYFFSGSPSPFRK